MLALIRDLEAELDAATNFRDVIHLIDDASTAENAVQAEALRRAFSLWYHYDAEPVFPRLDDVPANIVEQWYEALGVATHPVLTARLGDLCWQRRVARPHEAARTAIAAYMALTDVWDGLDGYACASRALGLARAIGGADTIARIYALAEQRAEESLPDTNRPGISLRYLRLLVAAPARERRAGIEELLRRAREILEDDPHHFQTIVELQQRLAGEDHVSRRELQRELARRWGTAAARAEGMTKLFHLQTALEAARDEPELRAELLRLQAEIDFATLGFQRLEFEIPIDDARVERVRRELFGAATWEQMLSQLVQRLRPSGTHEDNRAEAVDAATASVIVAIARTLVLDPETRQARPIEDDDQRLDQELGAIERRNVVINAGLFVRPALRYLPLRFDPDPAELLAWLNSMGIPAALAAVVRDALFRWWHQDDRLGAAATFATALEALVRHHASLRGITTTTLATAQQRGGFRGMGDVLADLRGHIDESWRRFLRCVLVSDTGFNLRNRLFHGILLEPDEQDVAALALAALFLCRVSAPRDAD